MSIGFPNAMRLKREQLLQFLAPEIADLVLASPANLLAGRIERVSVLSCDVAAFRPRAEAQPAEALEALNMILTEIAAVLLGHGGTLMSFPGDGALAVFGAPVATPDHSLMAAAAAAALRDPGLKRINTDLETAGFDPIALDVAVASGPAAVGVIGASPRWEYAAIGEVTSRAIAATTA